MAADSFALQNSMIREDTSPDFTSKQWSFMNDQNQSNYSTKQLVFDLSGFYNSQRFINLSEMFLVIPLVTTLSPVNDFATSATSADRGMYDGLGPTSSTTPSDLYAVGFKSGYWNLIYSMSVNVDGQDVVQLTPNINYYCNFMANTKWSQSDIAKHGPMCGFLPDDELSWGVNPTQVGGPSGYGAYNNSLPSSDVVDFQGVAVGVTGTAKAGCTQRMLANSMSSHTKLVGKNSHIRAHHNKALYERMLKTSRYVYPSVTTAAATVGAPFWDPKLVVKSGGDIAADEFVKNALGDGCFVVDPAKDATSLGSARVWITTAIIRFKDICQLFEKLPLTRSLYIRLLINLNIGHMTVYNPHLITNAAPAAGDQKILPYCTTAVAANVEYGGVSVPEGTASALLAVPAPVSIPAVTVKTAVPVYIPAAAPVVKTLDAGQVSAVMVNMTSYIANDASASIPKYGYGYISDNTFQGTCPLMLAKCVSSFYTNANIIPTLATSSSTDLATSAPSLVGAKDQIIESDVLAGMNCGLYSQFRTGLKLSIAVAKPETAYHPLVTGLASFAHGLSSTRVYAPSIEMEPSKALAYLENHKEQEVRYTDVLAYVLPGVSAGSSFNYLVANGIARAKRVIVMPFFHDDSAPSGAAVTVSSSWANVSGVAAPAYYNLSCSTMPFQPISPFDSAPSTTAPMGYIRSFQVQLSNSNIFQRNLDYDFEEFAEEVSECNAINGGLDTGLTSGQVDVRKWENNYRYYVANLSRRLAGDNTPKSITLQGINATLFSTDYYIFIEYERQFSLNVETGHISM